MQACGLRPAACPLKMKGYGDGPARYRCPTASLLEDEILAPPRGRHPAKWSTRWVGARTHRPARTILRKEVIQPQVPLRLPCYDFTPVTEPTVAGCLRLRGWRTVFG